MPGLTPVTTPELFTVATPVLEEDHGLIAAGAPDPVSVIVDALQTVVGPEIDGCGFTVTVAVRVQPLLLV